MFDRVLFDKAENITKKLIAGKKTISFVESCTGGLISALFTSVSGVSECFTEGFVTYSNESKERLVGVRHETLEMFGAVSSETVHEMLDGTSTDVAAAVSGVAGPLGGTVEKPVGTVFTGVRIGDKFFVQRNFFEGDRESIRFQSVDMVLDMLNKYLTV